jgi:pentatricopeptide repeat protein
VERALNLFEEMSNRGLYPTDVTFNTLINACARRTDYYQEAFNLLNQMQEVHGFEPDRVTFNTLMHGCAKKKDLIRARDIFKLMLKKTRDQTTHHQMNPDDRTYSSLLWAYASYRPPKRNSEHKPVNMDAENSLVPVDGTPLYSHLPINRRELVGEAQAIFRYAKENMNLSPAVLNAYLGVHIAHYQSEEIANIYENMFDQLSIPRNGYTFKHVLEYCYRAKDIQLAYKVWDDREGWLDAMRQQHHIDSNEPQAVARKKETDLASSQAENGWTMADQRASILLMANTMSR